MRHVRIFFPVAMLACAIAVAQAPQQSPATQPIAPATGPLDPVGTQPPAPPVAGAKHVTAKDLTREQMEQFLLNAPIASERPAGNGITHTRRVTMTDGRI